ncbi:MAG: NUDIX domain-containing protein [Anaerolineae bacterium]
MIGPYRPVVTDDDEFVRCENPDTIHHEELPHRTVWGMVYSPARRTWLVQWRRPDKEICPNLWDTSCGGHVDCVQGVPETYELAYLRELWEELGLTSTVVTEDELVTRLVTEQPLQTALTVEIGHVREYHLLPTADGGQVMHREQVRLFVTLYDGGILLSPYMEPQAVAWMSADRVHAELLITGRATIALNHMLTACEAWLARAGLM